MLLPVQNNSHLISIKCLNIISDIFYADVFLRNGWKIQISFFRTAICCRKGKNQPGTSFRIIKVYQKRTAALAKTHRLVRPVSIT